jgi:hypothetical protein
VQVEEEASDEITTVSRWGELQPVFSQFSFDEGIYGMAVCAWRFDLTKRLEGPVFPSGDVRLEGSACQNEGAESGVQRKATM